MWRYSYKVQPACRRARFGLGDEADLRQTGVLHRVDGAADAPIGNVDVAADMHFGQILRRQVLNAARLLDVRLQLRDRAVEQLVGGPAGQVPVDRTATVGDRKRVV